MRVYHKINAPWKRDGDGKFIYGEWSRPEFRMLANNLWLPTEKVDGMNMRIILNAVLPFWTMAGRSDRAIVPKGLAGHIQAKYGPLASKLLDVFPEGAVLFGEGYGPGIQKGGKTYGGEQRFILFDIWANGRWGTRCEVQDIADEFDIPLVSSYRTMTLWDAEDMVKEGFKSELADCPAEGLVLTPVVPLLDHRGHRIITKLKTRDYR